MKNRWLFVLMICCSTDIAAQQLCGNPVIDTAAMARAEAQPPAGRAVSSLIRVYFHILKNDDGSNAAASLTQLQQEFQRLQAEYAPHNICFAYMGVDSINSTFLNLAMNSDNPAHYNVLAGFNVANCINIYYVANLPGYGGNAFSIPSDFCVVARGNINVASTISHEVGHCIGLMHTFETAHGEENIDGSNCSTAGDRVCDTRADPLSHRGESCFSFSTMGCLYTGNCSDPTGATNFSPPYSNIMSYWGLRNCTVSTFSAGQVSRINTYLVSSPILTATISGYNYTYGPVSLNSGTSMQSAANALITNGSVQLGGSVRATLQARSVKADPGFRANPSTGKIILKPAECSW